MLIVVLILAFMPFAAADPLGQVCGTTSGNYTANSTYQANLEHLSTILPKNTSSAPTLFVKGSLGAAPDIVYGLALCRGDANSSACNDCVAVAFQDAHRLCAYNKDVTIFYDACTLRFANFNFFDPTDPRQSYLILRNDTEPGNDERITLLAQRTADLAAYNHSTRMYATGRMDVTSPILTLFSMAQCSPDLSPYVCRNCLQGAISRIVSGSQGGRTLSLWCNFRYEMYPFYQGQPMLQIESSGTNSTTNTAASPPPPPPIL